jgi:Ca2+-binding EF-hand superfamily protein
MVGLFYLCAEYGEVGWVEGMRQTIFYWTLISRRVSEELHNDEKARDAAAAVASEPLTGVAGRLASAAEAVGLRTPSPKSKDRQQSFTLPSTGSIRTMELTQEDETQIQEAFELFDTDGSGTMDKKELAAAMFALGFESNKGLKIKRRMSRKRSVERLTSAMDADGSETVDLAEFRSLMRGELTSRGSTEKILQVYQRISQEGDGTDIDGITAIKLKKTGERVRLVLDMKEIQIMVEVRFFYQKINGT